MGVAISRIWGSYPNYESDETTGLSGEEKLLLAQTFDVLKQDLSKSGERLFILYFKAYPENKRYFRDFKDKTIEELEGSPLLIAHGTNVMTAINGIILTLNQPETLVALIKKVGYNHGRRNIEPKAFTDLKEIMLQLLQETLKNKYNQRAEKVWSKALDVIFAVFKMGSDEYHAEKNQS